MPDNFRERVCFACLQRPRLDDKIAVASSFTSRREVNADIYRAAAEIGRCKLINDSRDVGGDVLRRLHVFCVFRRDYIFGDNRHSPPLSSNAVNVEGFAAYAKYKSHTISSQSTAPRGRRASQT